jgi:transcription termination/antitermination protein NusG
VTEQPNQEGDVRRDLPAAVAPEQPGEPARPLTDAANQPAEAPVDDTRAPASPGAAPAADSSPPAPAEQAAVSAALPPAALPPDDAAIGAGAEPALAPKTADAGKTPERVPPAAKRPAPAAPKAPPAEAVAEVPPEPKSENMNWYILKVQSNREESIREGLLRRVKIAGLEPFFGDVIVPTEKVTELKGGKKRVIKRKLYPGYLVVHMEINEDTWYLVRETPGIGDFTGATSRGGPAVELKATPMLPHEVARIVAKQEEKSEKAPKLKIAFAAGDRVKINEGTFENFEGEVDSIDETNGRVTVMINIFGRSTPVELEYWQIEAV